MDKKGELIAVSAPSGAGKTTIVRTMLGQIKKKKWIGKISIADLNPKNKKDYSRIMKKISYVPQLDNDNLYHSLSLREVNVYLWIETHILGLVL